MPAPPTRHALAVAAGAALAVSVYGTTARATDCGAPLLSTCIDSDHFWPHAGSAHFLSIGPSETIQSGQIGFGIVASYQSRPITISQPTPGPPGTVDNVIDDQVTTSFLWSYGVTSRLELDLVLPVTLGQTGTGATGITGAAPSTGLTNTATRDLRFGVAYALLKRDPVDPYAPDRVRQGRGDGLGVAARFEVSAPTGDTGVFATNGTGVFVPGLSADYRWRGFVVGAEAGLRLRPTQEFAGARIGSQAYVAGGVSYDILPRELFTLAAELFALPTFAEQHSTEESTMYGLESVPCSTSKTPCPYPNYIVPGEWMASLRSAPLFGGAIQIQLAGGGPLSDAFTNPRFRFSLSIRYARQGRDSDGDGVVDDDDKCPFVAGLPNNPAGRGCPATATTEKLDLTGLPAEPSPTQSNPTSNATQAPTPAPALAPAPAPSLPPPP